MNKLKYGIIGGALVAIALLAMAQSFTQDVANTKIRYRNGSILTFDTSVSIQDEDGAWSTNAWQFFKNGSGGGGGGSPAGWSAFAATNDVNIGGNNITNAASISLTGGTNVLGPTYFQTNVWSTNSFFFVEPQSYSTNGTAQIMNVNMQHELRVILQTNNLTLSNIDGAIDPGFGVNVERRILGNGSNFVCNTAWHGVGSYSTNGGKLTNGTWYLFALSSDYVVSTNAYFWSIVPANN